MPVSDMALLAEAGFRENGRVKGYAWIDPTTLELWYCMPNYLLALQELEGFAAALNGRPLEVGEVDRDTPGLEASRTNCARVRVIFQTAPDGLQYAASNCDAFH